MDRLRARTRAFWRAACLSLATALLLACARSAVREELPAPDQGIKPFTLKLTDEMNRSIGFAFDQQGRRAAVSGHKGATVEILDLATQQTLLSLAPAGSGGSAVTFGNGGKLLAAALGSPTSQSPAGEYQGVKLVAVRDAGKIDRVQVWGLDPLAEIGILEAPKPGKCLGGSVVRRLFFTADGSRVFAGSGGVNCGQVSLWEISSRRLLWSRPLGSTLTALALSPGGNHLAVGNGTEFQRPTLILDGADGSTTVTLEPALYGTVQAVAFSPRTDLLAVTRDTAAVRPLTRTDQVIGGIELWRTKDWKLQATVPIPWKNAKGGFDRVRSISFSPDGTRLAFSTASGVIEVLDLSTNARSTIPFDANYVFFNPDGRHLAALREKTLSLLAVADP